MKKKRLVIIATLLAICMTSFTAAFTVSAATVNAQKVTTGTIIADIVAAGKDDNGVYGKVITGDLFDYTMGYGIVDSTAGSVEFNPYEVSNGGLRTSAVYNTSNYQASVMLTGGTSRVSNYKLENGANVDQNFNVIIKLNIKKNVTIAVTHGSRSNSTSLLWANTFKKNSDGITQLKSHNVTNGTVVANEFGGSYTLNEGDEFYFEFALVSTSQTQLVFYSGMWPTFEANEMLGEFETLQLEKVEELTNAKNALSSEDYVAENLTALQGAYDTAIAAVEAATVITEFSPIENALKEAIAEYLSIAKATEYRTETIEKLSTHISAISESDYLATTWQEIQGEIAKLESAISSLSLKSAIDGAYNASVLAIAQYPKDAPVTSLDISLSDFIGSVYAAGNASGSYDAKGENQLAYMSAGYGRVYSNLDKLELNGYEVYNSGLRSEAVYNASNYNSSAIIPTSLIRVTNFKQVSGKNTALNGNAILVFEAKDNLKITISHDAGSAVNTLHARIWATENGKIYLLKSTSLANDFDANAYGGEFTVATGEKLFLEFNIHTSDFKSVDLKTRPSFHADVIAADEVVAKAPEVNEPIKVENTSLSSMIIESGLNGNSVVNAEGANWQLLHGTPEQNAEFELIDASVLRTEGLNANGYNSVYAAYDKNKFVRTNPVNNDYLLVKFTATENVKISVTNEAWEKATHSLGGKLSMIVESYVESRNGMFYYTANEFKLDWPSSLEADAIAAEVHLKAGDSLYYVMAGANAGTNMEFMPLFTADIAGFDASLSIDFNEYVAALDAIAAKKTELTSASENLAIEDYDVNSYLSISEIYEQAIEKLDSLQTLDEVTALIDEVNAKVADYLKVNEVEEYRAQAVARLYAEIASLDQKAYKEETFATIIGYKTTLESAIADLTRRSEIDGEVATAIEQIKAVAPDAPAKPAMKSCFSSLSQMTTIFVVLALVAICFVAKKKVENN